MAYDLAALRQHFHELIAFWAEKRVPDRGGYHTMFLPNGSWWRLNYEPLLMRGRLLYVFSEGMRFGIEQAAVAAEHVRQHLPERLRTGYGWYGSRYDDEWCNEAVLDAYDNLFVVMGLARYHQVTGDAWAGEEAWRLFQQIEHECANGVIASGGLFGANQVEGRSRGKNYFRWGTHMPRYSGNVMLHYTECLARLQDAGIGDGLADRVAAVRQFFLARLFDFQRCLVIDYYRDGWDQPDYHKPGQVGHTMEWIDFFRCFGDLHLPEDLEREILRRSLERALTPSGIFQSNYYFSEERCGGLTEFWAQPEAAKIFNLGSLLYGEPYSGAARSCFEAYMRYFVADDGGIYCQADATGVITDRSKGGSWKCDFHATRMIADLLERGILQTSDTLPELEQAHG
jgi:mannose/cellobiose epimerase-like protein (N-acyl-D-glucosamine 2-epimerase family)